MQTLALRFGVALLLGVMLGLERERNKAVGKGFAGVRTFALIALLGATVAHAETELAMPWLTALTFAAVALLVAVSYAVTAWRGSVGITTEISVLIAFLIGCLCARGQLPLAAMLAIASALLLALKDWLHGIASKISADDIEATLKFAIVTVVILPLVPNQNYGPPPLDVINPRTIWLMVVLISALDFASYVLVKLVGAEHGIGLTGLLGGLVSSTAVTLGFAKRSKHERAFADAFALAILIAWGVMFARVIVMVGVLDRALALRLLFPMGAMGLLSLLFALHFWRLRRGATHGTVEVGQNPFELGQALKFGLLFGLVTFAAKAAQVHFGESGLYAASALAGLTDVDAITLSMTQLSQREPEQIDIAARSITIATLANTLLKSGLVATLGSAELRKLLLPFAACIVGAGALVVLL